MRGMREMVRKAGTALLRSFHSMRTTLIIMRLPVRMSAGPVQYTGMLAARAQRHKLSCRHQCHGHNPGRGLCSLQAASNTMLACTKLAAQAAQRQKP